jgi:hypothetical protein
MQPQVSDTGDDSADKPLSRQQDKNTHSSVSDYPKLAQFTIRSRKDGKAICRYFYFRGST